MRKVTREEREYMIKGLTQALEDNAVSGIVRMTVEVVSRIIDMIEISGEEESAVTLDMVYAAEADRKKWEDQARRAKKTFPDLDLNVEMQNPKFCQLIGAGIDVGTAYQVTHIEELAGGSDEKLADKELKACLIRAKRKIEKLGAEVQYRAEMEEEGCYKIFVKILDEGTEARSRSQMSCSTSGEAFRRA